jgi:hypothetical protein
MGKKDRENQERREYNRSLPMRIIKAIAGLLCCFVLIPISVAMECYNRNEWPWTEI